MSDTTADVTVVVCCYKNEHLADTLQSLIAQTHKAFAVIVVDDSPTSVARTLVERLDDHRFRYVHNETRLGPAGSHRRGLDLACTTYAAILNDDDLWDRDFLKLAMSILDANPEVVLVSADHGVIDSHGNENLKRSSSLRSQFGRDKLTSGIHRPFYDVVKVHSVSIAQASVFRTAALPPLPTATGRNYDFWISSALASTNKGMYYLDQKLAYWREHDKNLTSQGADFQSIMEEAFTSRAIFRLRGWHTRECLRNVLISHLRLIRHIICTKAQVRRHQTRRHSQSP